ncbi:hypothetical protein G6L15_08440 [Agrobacterium rhizogenes]|uniref:hypothetical protein n=1 Tax=Rhizobium rhizogenes TaxID=359 RepID=UPI001571C774|nr:hypothetical protein [Rhizobium rhizogenes]NTG86173.1 hypothetical protein [Rhizobium rhizogenes]
MRRIEDNQGGDDGLAGPSISTHGPPREQTVIPFPRDRRAASVDLAAAGDPRQDPAAFIPLGQAVSAVVMRVRNSRLKVKVQVQTTEGTE